MNRMRVMQLAVVVAAAVVALTIFLIPIVPVTVTLNCSDLPGCPYVAAPAQASITYAYFGVGAVQVPHLNDGGYSYCVMHGNPGSMCGVPVVMYRGPTMMSMR
ncbi:MAG: hypothetical protein ABSF83_00090 [Nitrososphaerales archaeon]|jgi:hypothetical protein